MYSNFFNMGKVVVTHSIHTEMQRNPYFAKEISDCLQRYACKDWGNLCAEDKQINEDALDYPEGLYLLGVYETSKGKIDIITNRISETAGDNGTTVCYPIER